MNRKSIALIYLGSLLIASAFGISLLFPLLVKAVGGNEATVGWILLCSGIATVIAIWWSKSWLQKMKSTTLASIGTVLYAVGILFFIVAKYFFLSFFLAGVLTGIGWGIFYNVSPYLLTLFTNNENRSAYLSYLSAFVVLGMGISPALIHAIYPVALNFNLIFIFAALLALAAAIVLYIIPIGKPEFNNIEKGKHILAFSEVIRSNLSYTLLMVLLGGCVFTILLNFQTLYAAHFHLNYAKFYLAFTLSMVSCRLIFSQYLTRFNAKKTIVTLLGFMVLSVFLFLLVVVNHNFYLISSILFGISYGLSYPIIQAISIDSVEANKKAEAVSYFSLSYFIGSYGFPVIAGEFITHLGYNYLMIFLGILTIIEFMLAIGLLIRGRK